MSEDEDTVASVGEEEIKPHSATVKTEDSSSNRFHHENSNGSAGPPEWTLVQSNSRTHFLILPRSSFALTKQSSSILEEAFEIFDTLPSIRISRHPPTVSPLRFSFFGALVAKLHHYASQRHQPGSSSYARPRGNDSVWCHTDPFYDEVAAREAVGFVYEEYSTLENSVAFFQEGRMSQVALKKDAKKEPRQEANGRKGGRSSRQKGRNKSIICQTTKSIFTLDFPR
eukprot:scaffold3941_cov223-Amphora_coffeaeformis.AAC.1